MVVKHVTLIQCISTEVVYLHLVSHECSCGEFAKDIQKEAKKFIEETEKPSQVDVFWHLDEYCEKHYGPCHWQTTSIESLIQSL